MKKRNQPSQDMRRLPRRGLPLPLLLAWTTLVPCATALAAGAGNENGLRSILAYLLAVPVLCALGLGLGSFAFLVNHLFRTRVETTYRILRARPGLSFLAGSAVTLLALGLSALLARVPALQGLVFLGFLLAFAVFAAAAVTRFAAQFIDADPPGEVIPGAGTHLKAGLVLLLANLLPFAGTLLAAVLALAGTGAVLLGYFASAGRAAASLTKEASRGPGEETGSSG